MAQKMAGKKSVLIMILVSLGSLACIIWGIISLIASYKITDGCFMRYASLDPGSMKVNTNVLSFSLRADGNYTTKAGSVSSVDSFGNTVTTTSYGLDPAGYGKWYKVQSKIYENQKVVIDLNGQISLCKTYLPGNNIEQNSDKNKDGSRIVIPRVEDVSDPVPLILKANSHQWRNLLYLNRNDSIAIYIGARSTTDNHTLKSTFGGSITANCSPLQNSYNPICGLYTPYSGRYTSKCNYDSCGQTGDHN